MRISIPLLLSASSLFIAVMGRTFTVTNNCPFTIWYLSALMWQLRHFYPLFPGLLWVSMEQRDLLEFTTSQIFTDLNVGTATPSQPAGYVHDSSFLSRLLQS